MRFDSAARALFAEESPLVALAPGGDIRVAVCYPNRYTVAMSNLGFQAIYRVFGNFPRFIVERAYLSEDSRGEISTFESGSRLSELDILALSVSFETDYSHVLTILEQAGLGLEDCLETKPRVAEQSPNRPFLLGGGAALTLNPEPLANFFDAIVIGEGEGVVEEISRCYIAAREEQRSFNEFLRDLSGLDGVYVPSLYQPVYGGDRIVKEFRNLGAKCNRVERHYVKNLDSAVTHTVIQTPNTEFKAMFMTETGRGCEVGCRFCVSGYMYRPTRKRSEEAILKTVQLGLERAESIGFVGAAVSSHPAISRLTRYVAAQGKRAALSSIMSQKVTKDLAESLTESEYKSLALAPEAGSERLRFAIGKRVCDEQIIDAVKTLAAEGIRNFKFYFMVGLPSETEDDVLAIPRLVTRAREQAFAVCRSQEFTTSFVLSVNPFIPKAWTPFQRHGMLPALEVQRRLQIVRRGIAKVPNVEMKAESPRESYFQALVSRGDRRVGDLLVFLHREKKDYKSLVRQGSKVLVDGVPEADFYALRTFAASELFPWEVVDLRIKRELLEREYQRTFEEDVAPLITRARQIYREKRAYQEKGVK